KMRVLRMDLACHDADWRPAVDVFQTIENRPQKGLPFFVAAHVVDGENHHSLHSLFTDPLRRDQLGEVARDIIRIEFVQVREPVAIRSRKGGSKNHERKQGKKNAPAHYRSPKSHSPGISTAQFECRAPAKTLLTIVDGQARQER